MTMPILVRDDALVPTVDMHRAGPYSTTRSVCLTPGCRARPPPTTVNNYFGLHMTDVTRVLDDVDGLRASPKASRPLVMRVPS